MNPRSDYCIPLPDADIRAGQIYRSGSGLRTFRVLSVCKDVIEYCSDEDVTAVFSSRIMWDFDIHHGRIILQEEA